MPLSLLALVPASALHIEVLTMGPGSNLFERFGHAAICVIEGEPARSTRCFNYGTTDFGSPPERLGWEFLRGTSRFWVSVSPRERMLRAYQRADRSVYSQRIPLTPDQARAVAERLERDARPENRYYLYHHLHDNCATRVRDVIDAATGHALSRDARPMGVTYRDLGRAALAGESLALLSADLLVGRAVDRAPTTFEAAFLPHVLRGQIAERLHAPPELVSARRGDPVGVGSTGSTPSLIGVCAAVSVPLVLTRAVPSSRRLLARAFTWMSALLLTALGLAVWGVACVSTMPELSMNEALLLFWPVDFLVAALPSTRARWYARVRVTAAVSISALSALGVLHQPLLAAALVVAVPMALIASLRKE